MASASGMTSASPLPLRSDRTSPPAPPCKPRAESLLGRVRGKGNHGPLTIRPLLYLRHILKARAHKGRQLETGLYLACIVGWATGRR